MSDTIIARVPFAHYVAIPISAVFFHGVPRMRGDDPRLADAQLEKSGLKLGEFHEDGLYYELEEL